jgi:hypothetical protein
LVLLELDNAESIAEKLRESEWGPFLKSHEGNRFTFQMDKTKIPSFARDLVQMGAGIITLQPKHSLEDFFLSLTTANQHVDAFTN